MQAGSGYVPLVKRSWQLFEALQDSTGIPCLHQTGCLGVGHHGHDLVQDCKAACDEHSLEHTILSAAEVQERFKGYNVRQPVRGSRAPRDSSHTTPSALGLATVTSPGPYPSHCLCNTQPVVTYVHLCYVRARTWVVTNAFGGHRHCWHWAEF